MIISCSSKFSFHRTHSIISHFSMHHFFPNALNFIFPRAESRCEDCRCLSNLLSHFSFSHETFIYAGFNPTILSSLLRSTHWVSFLLVIPHNQTSHNHPFRWVLQVLVDLHTTTSPTFSKSWKNHSRLIYLKSLLNEHTFSWFPLGIHIHFYNLITFVTHSGSFPMTSQLVCFEKDLPTSCISGADMNQWCYFPCLETSGWMGIHLFFLLFLILLHLCSLLCSLQGSFWIAQFSLILFFFSFLLIPALHSMMGWTSSPVLLLLFLPPDLHSCGGSIQQAFGSLADLHHFFHW